MSNKYLDISDFKNSIDSTFWKHLTKESLITDCEEFKDIDKDNYICELARKINDGNYKPQVCKTIGFPKNKGVIRPIYHMSIDDSLIFYYCVKKIQNKLVEKISTNEYVFGGFRITKELKLTEDKLENLAFDPEYECFAKANFRKSWSDYQVLANTLADGQYDNYLHLDIAHFYDAIPLNVLEKQVRSVTNGNEKIVDLLFYLLKNIKESSSNLYIENQVGIPQEEIGEMSRLLANFYLHTFDSEFIKELNYLFGDNKGYNYQYTRYADDLWIVFRGCESHSYSITQIVSHLLKKIGLHLNESKTLLMSEYEYRNHWSDKTWTMIAFNQKKPLKIYELLKRLYKNKHSNNRWFTPFHYGLKKISGSKEFIDNLKDDDYKWLLEVIENCPKLITRNNKQLMLLIKKLIYKNDLFKHELCKLIQKENSLYPVNKFALSAIFIESTEDFIIEFFKKIYFEPSWEDIYWYQRCISLNYFTKHSNTYYLTKTKELLNKIKDHIKNTGNSLKNPERRYAIKFLISLPMQNGIAVLEETFSNTEDKEFISYLRR